MCLSGLDSDEDFSGKYLIFLGFLLSMCGFIMSVYCMSYLVYIPVFRVDLSVQAALVNNRKQPYLT